jgi:ssDNA-binding Zn-finger/Zn-ribbon topoisomerase 1
METTESDRTGDETCEECGTRMHLRQSWTGQTYSMCPECN